MVIYVLGIFFMVMIRMLCVCFLLVSSGVLERLSWLSLVMFGGVFGWLLVS